MEPLHLTADRLWDGSGQASILRPTIKIVGTQIEHVGQSLLAPAVCSGQRLDFPGCTILPGLIDTHVHLVMAALSTNAAIIEQVTRESDQELFERAQKNGLLALRAGITTVRDCGGRGTVIQDLRDAVRGGAIVGPDIFSCGAPITTTLGHCHWLGLVADSANEVERAGEKMLAEKADFLKIMATGGNMTPTSDPMQAQYDPATLKLLADLGRKHQKPSAAHVLSRAALPGVVAANYRTIEHCDWRVEENRYEFDPELARRIVDQNQVVGLTLSGTMRRAFLPELTANPTPPVKRLDIRFACERQMLDFGVAFTLHSDAGVRMTPIERFDLGLRAAQIELKLTPHEVLSAVTRNAAAALDLSDRGILKAGKRADLIVVEGDPLRDLEAIGRVKAVVKNGAVIPLAG